MGTPKALLPWAGTTLLDYAICQARESGVEHVVVVLGPATRDLAHQLSGVIVSCNPDPDSGRSTSIRLGSQALPDDLDAIVIQSVDQPCEGAVLAALFTALDHADVAVPTHAGRRGHPVCLRGSLLPQLRAVTEEEQGLRSLVARHAQLGRLIEVPVNAPSVVWNLNDPAAYAAARAAATIE